MTMEEYMMMERENQTKIFEEMKAKAKALNKLMLIIEISQMERAFLEKGEETYLFNLCNFPDLLEVAKVGFLQYNYYDRNYTCIKLA